MFFAKFDKSSHTERAIAFENEMDGLSENLFS